MGVYESNNLIIIVPCTRLYGDSSVLRKTSLEESRSVSHRNPQESLSNGMLMLLDYSRLIS